MRTQDPKHPIAAMCQAALFAAALIALWLVLIMFLPNPEHVSLETMPTGELAAPRSLSERVAACDTRSYTGTGFAPAFPIPLSRRLLPPRNLFRM
jgi:hypothetical protein